MRLALICMLFVAACGQPAARDHGPFPQRVYVWQRAWTPEVGAAVRQRAGSFDRTLALATEVTWHGAEPVAHRVAAVLTDLPRDRSVGLAVRITPRPDAFAGQAGGQLLTIAMQTVAAARAAGLEVAELQIDHDQGSRHLEDYAAWLRQLKPQLAEVALTVTALPDWLDRDEFAALAATADSFTLQVHALTAPAAAGEPGHLCDPRLAQRAVERAATFGRPFWVALPTYSYLAAFAPNGQLYGLLAEQRAGRRLPTLRWQELAPNPADMAALVRQWQASRPPEMQGVVWFRLPVDGDQRNWRWPTLQAVAHGRDPLPQLRSSLAQAADGSWQLVLANLGDGDGVAPSQIAVQSPQQIELAGALPPWQVDGAVWHQPTEQTGRQTVRAGESQTIGWLRGAGPFAVEDTHETP